MERKRRSFTTRLDQELIKKIQKLAIDLRCNANDLIEVGMRMVLKEPPEKPKK